MELAPQQQPVPDGQQPVKTKKKRSPVERFLRGVCWLLFSPIILFFVLTLLLYVPFVQDWAVGIVCEKISEATGLDVEVERLRISFPLDVDLQQLCITDPHNQTEGAVRGSSKDTVLAVNSCILDLDLSSLFSGQIAVDALDLRGVVADTHDVLPTLVLKGRLDAFHLDVHDLEFKDKRINITAANLKGCDLDIALRDTTVIDTTTSEPLPWLLNFGPVEMQDTRLVFHTVRDTMVAGGYLRDMTLDRGHFDLERNKLHLESLCLVADSLFSDFTYEPYVDEGLDINHLRFYDVDTRLKKLDFDLNDTRLNLDLPKLTLREKSGLQVDELSAEVYLDTTRIRIGHASLKTPSSRLRAEADVEWAALDVARNGNLSATLSADFSRRDVMLLARPYLPASVLSAYPDQTLTAEVDIDGNLRHLAVSGFRVLIPGMIDARLAGNASHLIDNGQLSADLEWDVHTKDLSLLRQALGLHGIKLPAMDLTGTTHIDDGLYKANLLLQQGGGSLALDGWYNSRTDAYRANLDAHRFVVSNFLPLDSVLSLTARAEAEGRGYDLFSRSTRLQAVLDVPSGHYGSLDLGNLHLDGNLSRSTCWVNFYSGGKVLNADGCVEVYLDRNKIDSASFSFDMRGLDLYALGVTKQPFKASMTMHMQGGTDLVETHNLKGNVTAMQLAMRDSVFYPRDISLEAFLNPDTTYAFLSAGDLLFRLNSTDGLKTLMTKSTLYADSLSHQMESRQYDHRSLISMLPTVDLCIQSNDKNPLANILHSLTGYSFQNMDVDMHTDNLEGVRAAGYVHTFNTGSIVLDTINFDLRQADGGTHLDAHICNGKKNKDVTFDSRLTANLSPGKVDFGLLFFDSQHRKGVDLGAELLFHEGERRLHLTPLRPILAYRTFSLNEDNYLLMHNDGRIDANFDMLADDGTGLKIFSTPNEDAEQDLTLSLNRLNLGELCSVMPYMPRITGLLHGDLHYVQQGGVPSVMADIAARDMTFEGSPMGHIGVNAAYMPNSDGSHYVDGLLTQNENQVLSFSGTYAEKGSDDALDASVQLENFPLALANGFLGETMQLTGQLLGDLTVRGSTSSPRVNGELLTQGVHLLSPLYSVDLRVEDDKILLSNSILQFSKLKGYTTGSTPLSLDGHVDFSALDHVTLDMRAKAKDFELINAPKNRKAAAYGKVFVDLDVRARGSLQDLNVTGNLGVLGNTNVTYVLLDSPITVEDEMSDLVTFVDFSDTLEVEEPVVVPPSNLRMNLKISIDQASNVNCLLSQDGVNYVKLEGGGDLTMAYDAVKGLQLYGRYTILQGKMTYTMMVVSLKDCEIKNGSYVEFAGDVSNPRLSVAASERVNSTITENGSPRTVAFDVGVDISQTLSNMGLAFTLKAPEDLNVQNQIAQMTDEQRSRVAVMLMATGIYLIEGQNPGEFDTTNALNTFLQSQINSITGKALNSFDISLGVQNGASRSGSMTTDYSFRFAKRFWGNRISLIVGGKVSSGADAQNTGESIIENVSIEYRLDKSATRYVTLFYNTNNESVLEGRIVEMGAGLVLRRKTNHLGELFLFRSPKKEDELPLPEEKSEKSE